MLFFDYASPFTQDSSNLKKKYHFKMQMRMKRDLIELVVELQLGSPFAID